MRVRVPLLAVLVMCVLPASAAADYSHVVQRGETLTSVAAVDGLSIEAIAQANGISPQAELVAGQILLIPPQTAETLPSRPRPRPDGHRRPCDTATETSTQTEDTSYTQPSTPSEFAGDTRAHPAAGVLGRHRRDRGGERRAGVAG